MRRLLQDMLPILRLFFTGERRMLLAGVALGGLTILSGMALLGVSGWFITATAIAGLSSATALAFDVFMPSAGIRLLALGRTASRYGERLVTHDATMGVLAALRERLFRGWAVPGAAGAMILRPSRLLFRLTADLDSLDSVYLRVLAPLGGAMVAALATGIALGLMQPLFGLAIFGFLLVVGLGVPLLTVHSSARAARRRAQMIETLRARAIDLVQGQSELVMAGRIGAQRDEISAADARLARADDRLNRVEAWVSFGFGAAASILLAATLLASGFLVEGGVIGAPVAALAVLVAFASIEPFAALRRGAMDLSRTQMAARRIGARLAPEPAPKTPDLPPPGLAASLDGVTIRHFGAASPVLERIFLRIAAGAHVALIGPSGAGKSSLLAALAGEMFSEAGQVSCRPSSLLTQRTELFRDSLRENLLLAAPDAADADLLAALEGAGLAADFAAMPEGLDARLGEGGLGLSGGQARRLALARMILRDPEVWLLDEPTEGLDGATARDVIERLHNRLTWRTCIVATHIRREAELADRLIQIDCGRIVAIHNRGAPTFERALATLRPD